MDSNIQNLILLTAKTECKGCVNKKSNVPTNFFTASFITDLPKYWGQSGLAPFFPTPTALNHTLYYKIICCQFSGTSHVEICFVHFCCVHQVICCKSMWQVFFIFNLLFNFVISSSKFPDVSKNQNLCTPYFFKNTIHQSQCEPYDEQSFKKKNSFIKFFVSKKISE